jgi:hypothetical protein
MTSIASEWEHFASHVLPPDASDEQRNDMRKTFFCGAASMFQMLVYGLDPGPDAMVSDLSTLAALEQELYMFQQEIGIVFSKDIQ